MNAVNQRVRRRVFTGLMAVPRCHTGTHAVEIPIRRLQRDVSVSLEMLGNVLVAQGDLAGARSRYPDSLDIAKRLAAANPSSASLQRDVWVSMWNLASTGGTGVTWQQVVDAMEDMQRRGVLQPVDVRFLDEARRKALSAPAR